MFKNNKILAIIPARGGSKGLPNKNIKSLNGQPLISYSIKVGLESKYIDKVIVSTDSDEIAKVALSYKAEVPFLRPVELATDDAKTIDVVLHAIHFLEDKNEEYDIVVILEPTSPLREAFDVNCAIESLVSNKKAKSIVGISKVESTHPAFLVGLKNQFITSYINEDFKVLRRQEIDDLFFFEGSLYISYIKELKEIKNFYHKLTLGYVMPKWKAFEIDDNIDFIIIESLLKAKEKGNIL